MPASAAAPPQSAEAVAVCGLRPQDLQALNARQGWSLGLAELAAIQAHFRALRREPTRAELETLAQGWSERRRHKTFTSPIRYSDGKKTRRIDSLLAETIAKPAQRLKRPWCLSTGEDDAGIVAFGPKWALAFKVETPDYPSAGEPYAGAAAGLGGVIRRVMGAGLGAKPVLGSDVFCCAAPDYDGPLPEGVLHPRRVLSEMVGGVRDYGNRMGIPMAAGGLWFDADYRLDPLVFCGAVGLLPAWAVRKEVKAGDLIVAAGGRTGRDGLPAGAQPGHAGNEKKLLDALLAARDKKLYRGVADCGAGGLAAALAALAAKCGARVRLEAAPLKAGDLSPWEIWLSRSPERMVFAVPPRSLKAFAEVFASEGCETAVLGEFTSGGRLEVSHGQAAVADLDLRFLRDGLPRVERAAVWAPRKGAPSKAPAHQKSLAQILAECLGQLNVCSREWVVRQYDHEVQGGTVIKPLQGLRHDGPGDACVIWPHAATGDASDHRGFAVSHGLNPAYGRIDPYRMALACADEALRNLLCVGADISRAVFHYNFCWAGPEDPAQLGALVRAAEGCRDAALGFGVPFIAGQDSFRRRTRDIDGKDLSVPGTLLISALAPVADVRRTLTMEIKGPGNALYLVGWTAPELGGSLFHQVCGRGADGAAPAVDTRAALAAFNAVQAALARGLVLSAHDLSDGGLGVAAAEMCFTGESGAALDLDEIPRRAPIYSDETLLFSESASRILLEVAPEREAAFLKALRGAPAKRVGTTVANPVLKVTGLDGRVALESALCDLKSAWQLPLPRRLG
jgi:phosphoribosylformylglycinamidine synthase